MADPPDRMSPAGNDSGTGPSPLAPAGSRAPAAETTAWREPKAAGASRMLVAAVAALAIVAALAVWLDDRRAQKLLRTEVAERLAGVEASTQVAGKAQTQLATDLRDAQAKITLLETRIAESQTQQAALEALYRDLAPSRDEIALSEIEQVLLIASQQLQLAGNVAAALTALQIADAKLQRLERPQFVPLRRALSRDMDQLRAVPYVDITGVSLKLDQAIAAVGGLPLAMDERVPASSPGPAPPLAEEPPWVRFLRDIWTDIKQLVRVEVADRPAAPLIPPPQQYFLRENLRLRLLSARIALLSRDAARSRADRGAADEWVKQYFDTRQKSVQGLQTTLKQLAATPMAADLPDLTRSLEALRVLRLAQDRAPGRAVPGPAGR
jgi:uroporphyrin-3 C-methyltransferase